jgi:hypothetical protein
MRKENKMKDILFVYEKPRSQINPFVFILGVLVMLLIVMIVVAHSEINPPTNLWQGLIAEAVSEGPDGMYAVACVVRNRLNAGMNTGLVALKRRNLDEFVRREGRQAEHTAKDIVRKVFEEGATDITRGATHYEAVETFGMPKWARSMVRTVKIGKHSFYKARKK